MEIGSNYALRPTKKKEVVANTGIPSGYLENILIVLRNSGLVDATRGANGGFVLRRSPDMITMLEVVRVLQGPSDLQGGSDLVECVSEKLWQEVNAAQEDVLRRKTLADLIALKGEGGAMGFGI